MYVFLTVTAVFFILVLLLPRSYLRLLSYIYVLAIAIIAFKSVPVDRFWIDLRAYLAAMHAYRPMSVREFVFGLRDMDLPVFRSYLFLVSKLRIDGFLMGITIAICYSVNFYILFDAANRYKISEKAIRIAILFMISTYPYYDAVSWTKNPLAFALFAWSLYGEFIVGQKKIICWSGYILSLGIHTSMSALLMLRILLPLMRKCSHTLGRIFLLFISTIIHPAINLIVRMFPNSGYLSLLAVKVDSYFGAINIKSFNRWGVCVSKYATLVVAYLQYKICCSKEKRNEGISAQYLEYLELLLIFLLGTLFQHDLFTRMTIFAGIVFQPVLLITLQRFENEKENRSKYIKANVNRGMVNGVILGAMLAESILYLYFQSRGTLTLLQFS